MRVLFEKTGESDIAQNLHIIQKKKKFSFETIKKNNCGYLFLFGFCFFFFAITGHFSLPKSKLVLTAVTGGEIYCVVACQSKTRLCLNQICHVAV